MRPAILAALAVLLSASAAVAAGDRGAGYAYSDAMKAANRTWDEATLTDYVINPREKIPGVRMLFAGLPNESDWQNVIAYLSTLKS